jgi:hypothetical protein
MWFKPEILTNVVKMDELIAYVSQYFTLKKGDIIFYWYAKAVLLQ